METRSVLATGLGDDSYQDQMSVFRKCGPVEQFVRVLDTEFKFTGKAYVVYAKDESANKAVSDLTKNLVKVQLLGEDTEEFYSLVESPPMKDASEDFMSQWQTFTPEQKSKVLKMMEVGPNAESPLSGASFFGGGEQQ